MKLVQLIDSRNQHLVAIEKNGELRCYFQNHSIQTTGATLESLRRDIANHGDDVVNFAALPEITSRIAKSGRTVYDVAQQ